MIGKQEMMSANRERPTRLKRTPKTRDCMRNKEDKRRLMSSLELKKESKTTQLVPIQCLSKSSNVSTSSNSVRDKSKTRLALKRLLKLVQVR
jgi:hypothetical protein